MLYQLSYFRIVFAFAVTKIMFFCGIDKFFGGFVGVQPYDNDMCCMVYIKDNHPTRVLAGWLLYLGLFQSMVKVYARLAACCIDGAWTTIHLYASATHYVDIEDIGATAIYRSRAIYHYIEVFHSEFFGVYIATAVHCEVAFVGATHYLYIAGTAYCGCEFCVYNILYIYVARACYHCTQ